MGHFFQELGDQLALSLGISVAVALKLLTPPLTRPSEEDAITARQRTSSSNDPDDIFRLVLVDFYGHSQCKLRPIK